jgi:hypothetical protein
VVNRLIATADDAGPPGRDEQYGFGRLDLLAALTASVPAVAANPLGEPPAPGPDDATGRDDAAGGIADTVDDLLLPVLAVAGALVALVAAAVVVTVVLVRRRRRHAGPPVGYTGPPAGNTGPPVNPVPRG